MKSLNILTFIGFVSVSSIAQADQNPNISGVWTMPSGQSAAIIHRSNFEDGVLTVKITNGKFGTTTFTFRGAIVSENGKVGLQMEADDFVMLDSEGNTCTGRGSFSMVGPVLGSFPNRTINAKKCGFVFFCPGSLEFPIEISCNGLWN